jgi:hypothetical protein
MCRCGALSVPAGNVCTTGAFWAAEHGVTCLRTSAFVGEYRFINDLLSQLRHGMQQRKALASQLYVCDRC